MPTIHRFAVLLLVLTSVTRAEDLGLRVPDGFEVTLYAGDELAHNIFSMTCDSHGRIVVAGPNYVRRLFDDNGDGRADRAEDFSQLPASGAHGMVFDGDDLVCTGDNGVWRFRDADGDGRADDKGEFWFASRSSEHAANGIVCGPDGWLYMVGGNDARISEETITLSSSPVKKPSCGAIVRMSRDGKQREVLAHGFRNPYDLDFDLYGNLTTVDSDGERDHALPWYAPTRLFDVGIGQEHGWLLDGFQRSWNRPEWFVDNVPRAAEFGRGSPTGLICYNHRAFPLKYQGSIFSCCWTLGRVYSVATGYCGTARWIDKHETFLQTVGGVGFAPVDLTIDPAGDMFVAVGGRGTRGSVFRIHYQGPLPEETVVDNRSELDQVLKAPQPSSSWSRARWVPLAKKLGPAAFEKVLLDAGVPSSQRMRAVEILVDVFGGVSIPTATQVIAGDDFYTNARVAWALGKRTDDPAAQRLLCELTYDIKENVQRSAWEAILTQSSLKLDEQSGEPNWHWGVQTFDRHVSGVVLAAARGLGRESALRSFGAFNAHEDHYSALAHILLFEGDWGSLPGGINACVDVCLDAYENNFGEFAQVESLRVLQRMLGDIDLNVAPPQSLVGYTARRVNSVDADVRERIAKRLADDFPTNQRSVDNEVGRLLAMLEVEHPPIFAKLVHLWTVDSSPVDDVHYLMVSSRLRGSRSTEFTQATTDALLSLHGKLAERKLYPDRNWPLRVGECFEQLCAKDAALADAIADSPKFGRAEHSLFAEYLTGAAKTRAAERLLATFDRLGDEDSALAPPLIRVLSILPDEQILPRLRQRWDDYGLRDEIALVLAKRAQPEDRTRLVESLASPQASVIEAAAESLANSDSSASVDEIAIAVGALRQSCGSPEPRKVRKALADLLAHWTNEQFAIDDNKRTDARIAYEPWFAWFAAAHPDAAKKQASASTIDLAALKARLAGVQWDQGDVARGRIVFEKRACQRCHIGGGKLGPSLGGAVSRFSADDLFTAIADPNKDVAPLYQTTQVVTRSGQVHTGLLVYDSAEQVLVQIGPDTTVRIEGADVASKQPSRQSIMPSGLLNGLTDDDLADLRAFLKTLGQE